MIARTERANTPNHVPAPSAADSIPHSARATAVDTLEATHASAETPRSTAPARGTASLAGGNDAAMPTDFGAALRVEHPATAAMHAPTVPSARIFELPPASETMVSARPHVAYDTSRRRGAPSAERAPVRSVSRPMGAGRVASHAKPSATSPAIHARRGSLAFARTAAMAA